MDGTTPKTWADDELVTANVMNTDVRDNLNALKAPPTARYELNEASDYTTTSTSFVDVDGTKLALTITTSGGDVMVHFHGTMDSYVLLDIAVDGVRVGGDDGIVRAQNLDDVSFTRLIAGLSAGEHTFKLQWKVPSGTGKLYAGAGTSGFDIHPQFWAREMS